MHLSLGSTVALHPSFANSASVILPEVCFRTKVYIIAVITAIPRMATMPNIFFIFVMILHLYFFSVLFQVCIFSTRERTRVSIFLIFIFSSFLLITIVLNVIFINFIIYRVPVYTFMIHVEHEGNKAVGNDKFTNRRSFPVKLLYFNFFVELVQIRI